MPAWRLGRRVGSLLVLAVLAVGLANAGGLGRAGHHWADGDSTSTNGMSATDVGSGYQGYGFDWA